MTPEPSSRCTHPADEWCDECFVPTRHLGTLRALDAAAAQDVDAIIDGTPVGPYRLTADGVAEWQAILAGAGLDAPPPPVGLRRLTDSEKRQIAEAWCEAWDRDAPEPVGVLAPPPGTTQAALRAEYNAGWDAGASARADLADRTVAMGGATCVNARHTHGRPAVKESCLDDTVPPYPLVHRATGQVVLWGLVGVAAAGVAGWKAGEWLATHAALRLELHRMRRGA